VTEIAWILFDLGGVLVEIDQDRIFTHLSSLTGMQVSDIRTKIYSERDLWQHFIRNEWDAATLVCEVNRLLGGALLEEDIVAAFNQELGNPIESTASLIPKLLQNGIQVGCLSNTNSVHWKYLQTSYGFMSLFQVQFASQELGAAKPDSEIYETVEQRLQVTGNELLFFDDRLENIEAARARGWRAYQYSDYDSIISALTNHGLSVT
jgi:HAD superfamily hydrolase (TIGR01509 family)